MRRLALVALILLPAALAQDREAAAPPEAGSIAVKETPLEVRLQSGTMLVGRMDPVEWQVRTAFGVLTVPVQSVRHVRFGRLAKPERLAVVRDLITELASTSPERRHHARTSLRAEGAFAARDLLQAAQAHDDPEVKRISQEILDELDLDVEEILPDLDEIQTDRFNLAGTIELSAFKVTVPELGTLAVHRRDIVFIRAFAHVLTRKFSLTGNHIWPDGWLDTKLKVRKGQKLQITAQGTLQFPNWGQAFTPDGNPRMGNMSGHAWGTLVAKVGENGTLFRVGSSYAGKADASGTLYFLVMLQVRGQPSTGEYTVNVGSER
ncbi:MAG: hypothetical protein ACYSUM_06650 [Planctomycetota bacterium]|jgi:hypothetical protein